MALEIEQIYQAYQSDQMRPEEKAQFESDVNSGLITLPQGMSLKSSQNSTQTHFRMPQKLIDAYRNGDMTVEESRQFENDLADISKMSVPKEKVWINEPSKIPHERMMEQAAGQASGYGIGELISGEQRSTPETEALPDWTKIPEMNNLSWAGIKTIFGTMFSNPEEAVKIIKKQNPGVKILHDSKGNIILESKMAKDQGWKHTRFAIKPGLRASDFPRFLESSIPYAAAGVATGGAGLIPVVGGQMLTQTGIEATQTALGGEFNPEEIALAGATELGGVAISKGLTAGKGLLKAGESAGQTAVRSAEQAGIVPMTSDIFPPQSFTKKSAQVVSERIPIIGTGPVRVAQQESRVEAIRNVLREYGATETAQASDDVMKYVLEKRGKDLTKYTNQKKSVIEKLTTDQIVDTPTTVSRIDNITSELEKVGTKDAREAIKLFDDYKQNIQGKDLATVEKIRKDFGQLLGDSDLATIKSERSKYSKQIYNAIKEDMGKFIEANGDRRDFVKWKVANKRLSMMINDLDVNALKTVLKKGDATPEQVRKMLFSADPSTIRLLNKNLTKEGRAAAKIAILQEAVAKSGGIENLSTAKFSSNLKRLSKSIGVFFTGEDKKVIEGLQKALDLTKRAEISGIAPPTGVQNFQVLGALGLGSLLGGVKGVAATATIGMSGRIFESRAVRNILLKLSKAKPGQEKVLIQQLVNAIQSTRQLQSKKKTNL